MGILAVIVVLLVLLLASTWSSAKSYFAKGRLAGMEERRSKSSAASVLTMSRRARPLPIMLRGRRGGEDVRARGNLREEHLSIPGPALDLWRCQSAPPAGAGDTTPAGGR